MRNFFRLSVLLCSLLFVNTTVYSQEPLITKSKIFKDKKKHSDLLFSSVDGKGGVVVLRMFYGGMMMMPKGYSLEHYDSNLNLKSQKEFEIQDNYFKSMFVKDGTINLIQYNRNRKTNTNEYSVLQSDVDAFNFVEKELFSIDRKDVKKPFFAAIAFVPISNASKIDHDPTGEVQVSSDNNFIAFNFDIKDDKNETHRVVVYDKDFNQVFDQNFSQNIKDKYFVYNSFNVSNLDGSVYFLGKSYKNESLKEKVKGKINYSYKLYKIDNQGTNSINFSTENSFVSSLEILLDSGSVYCVGTYSEKDSDDYKGIAYFKINKQDLSLEVSKLSPFSKQFMEDKYGKKKAAKKIKKEKELPFLRYKDFFVTNNGEVYFNAEEFFITTHTTFNPNGGSTTRTVYHYNDVFTCKIGKEGNLDWIRTINKRQATSGISDYLSFSSTVNNGKMFIFLNGADEVKKLKDDRIEFRQKKTKKMNLYVIEVDPSGDFSYKILISDKDSKLTYKTQNGILSEDLSTIFFEGSKGKDKQLLKITL